MKILKSAIRVCTLLKPNPQAIKTKITPLTLTIGSLGTGYAFWYGSQKIFTEDVTQY